MRSFAAPLQSLGQRVFGPGSQPRIWTPLSRDKADTLLLLVTCVLVLAPHAAHLPRWIVLTGGALLLWRAWVTFKGLRMPPRWLLVPLSILTMGAVYATHKTLLGREAGVSMLALLLTLKLLEMHARRDLFVVLFLGLFLVLTGFFYSQGIGAALMMVAAVVAILTTQLSFQYVTAVPPLSQRLRLGAGMLLLAAPLTLVLFFLFPRVQGPLWGIPTDAYAARSGISETMTPGNISDLALSDEIAFRARFKTTPPDKRHLYWRGPVLGDYDGRTWRPLRQPRSEAPQTALRRGTPLQYQVTLEPNGRYWLFALDLPRTAPRQAGARLGPEMQVLARQPVNQRLRYELTSDLNYALQPNESSSSLQQWLQLPPGYNPRTRAFAARLRKEYKRNSDIVEAALRWFRTDNFSYTLEPPLLGTHAVDEFLFDTRAGFCEHYASSFVVLMRAAGVPARVVTGYQGGTMNAADGFMAVRQSDAHAWAEVWLANRGWTRIDPTAAVAPSRIDMNLANAIPRPLLGGLLGTDINGSDWLRRLVALREHWEALGNAWNQRVLGYTPEAQQELIRSLGFNQVDWPAMVGLLLAAAAAAMLFIAIALFKTRTRIDPVEAAYRALCRRMARRGLPRLLHEGPRAYRNRLTAAGSPLKPRSRAAVKRFLDLYETARYGVREPSHGRISAAALVLKLNTLLTECR